MKFVLSTEDAKRFGCPREVEFSLDRLMGREVLALQKLVGWNYEYLQRRMEPIPLTDPLGNQLYEQDEHGNEVRDEAGQRVRSFGMDMEVALVMLWLAVRRAKGGDVAWDDFDIDIRGTQFLDEEAGKADTVPTKTASTTTRKASRRGTTTTKRR